MSKELSVVIVNYNGKKYLKECLDSLSVQLRALSHEIVIVDNASQDGSQDYIREHYPDVNFIASPDNLGFGRGNNLGVSAAKGKYILLFNNDTVLLDPLEPAIELLESRPDIGIVAINMLDANKAYILATGRFPTPMRLAKLSLMRDNRPEFASGRFDPAKTYEADWVSGAFMLMRKSDFEHVGGFDSDYFMYVEDVDLCKRLSMSGKKCVFLPSLAYVHYVGFNKTRERQLLDAYKVYAKKHFSGVRYALARIALQINIAFKKLLRKL